MEKSQLITEVSKEVELSENEVSKILNSFIESIKNGLAKGEKVNISGFGTFSLAHRKARDFVNPKTQKTHNISEKKLPFFKGGIDFFKKN